MCALESRDDHVANKIKITLSIQGTVEKVRTDNMSITT